LFKKAQRLDKEFESIKSALSDINAFNAGKKREEAISKLEKWLPEAQKFTAQIKTVQGLVNYLEQAKDDLKITLSDKNEKLDQAWDEAYKFKKIADRQRNLLNKIPKKILDGITKTKVKTEKIR